MNLGKICILSVLIWVQTVYKGYQQMTKFAPCKAKTLKAVMFMSQEVLVFLNLIHFHIALLEMNQIRLPHNRHFLNHAPNVTQKSPDSV